MEEGEREKIYILAQQNNPLKVRTEKEEEWDRYSPCPMYMSKVKVEFRFIVLTLWW